MSSENLGLKKRNIHIYIYIYVHILHCDKPQNFHSSFLKKGIPALNRQLDGNRRLSWFEDTHVQILAIFFSKSTDNYAIHVRMWNYLIVVLKFVSLNLFPEQVNIHQARGTNLRLSQTH